jgi:hypothetical protein
MPRVASADSVNILTGADGLLTAEPVSEDCEGPNRPLVLTALAKGQETEYRQSLQWLSNHSRKGCAGR